MGIIYGAVSARSSRVELDEGLSSYALTSALHDTRFNPITARELPLLEAAVTLLTDFEDADDATGLGARYARPAD